MSLTPALMNLRNSYYWSALYFMAMELPCPVCEASINTPYGLMKSLGFCIVLVVNKMYWVFLVVFLSKCVCDKSKKKIVLKQNFSQHRCLYLRDGVLEMYL